MTRSTATFGWTTAVSSDILAFGAEHMGAGFDGVDRSLGSAILPQTIGDGSTPADQTARINAFLADGSPMGIKQLAGNFTITDTLTVPANTYVDASKAVITQTGTGKVSMTLGAGSTLAGGTIKGRAADYVPGVNVTPTIFGVRVNGAGAAIYRSKLVDHAGAGIYLAAGSDGFTANAVEISTSFTIPAGDSACFGIYVLAGTGHTFTGLNIHDVSIGIISSIGCTRQMFRGIRVHDIKGQHGLYIQDGTGLVVDEVLAWAINLNGVKLQLSGSSTADSIGCSITNITADSCGDCAVSVNNVAADLSNAKKIRGFTLSQVTATGCQRGIFVGSVVGGAITAITCTNTVGDAITLLDCRNLMCSGLDVDECGRIGVRLTSATGSVQDQITIKGLRVNNAVNEGNPSHPSAIYHIQGTNVTLDGINVTATNGKMQWGYFNASSVAADQTSLAVRNSEFSGANTNQDVRLQATLRQMKEWWNVRVVTTILNYPQAVSRIGNRGVATLYTSNAAPTYGVFTVGDEIFNTNPITGQPRSWFCTRSGGLPANGNRQNSTAYNVADWVQSSAGRILYCITAGTTAASEPTIPTTIGATVNDGSVVWQVMAVQPATFITIP